MNHVRPLLRLFVVAVLAWSASLHAADPGETVILVAKRELRDSLYGSSIIVAKPVGSDEHVGFIVNRPTSLTLGTLFPGHAPSRKVRDPVYLGGPVDSQLIFALVQRPESPGTASLQLMPGLFVAFGGETVGRIIEAEPEHARFVAGLVAWRSGELRAEIRRGLWHVLASDAALVMRKPEGLWEELVRRSERTANAI